MSYQSSNIQTMFSPIEISLMENILHDTLEEQSISQMFTNNDLIEMETIVKQTRSSRNYNHKNGKNQIYFDNIDLSNCDSTKRLKEKIMDYDSIKSNEHAIHKFTPYTQQQQYQHPRRTSQFQDPSTPSKLFNAFKPKRKKINAFILDKSLIKGFLRLFAYYIPSKIFHRFVVIIVQYWGHLMRNLPKTTIIMQHNHTFDSYLIKSINKYGQTRYHEIPRKATLKFIWLSHNSEHRIPSVNKFDNKIWKIKYSSNSIRFNKKTKAKDTRKVGKWFLGPTLGKGGYSWVKKGYDRKDGRIVALKFTSKLKQDWSMSQSKQISNEISALSQIRHPNILKLMGYTLNAKYPQKDGLITPTVLLVLEYAPGGELFDILYYTSALPEIISRTYYHQLIEGVEALHEAGICHRDIKPQNLLLDANFQLKIVDFGLAHVFEQDEDFVMKTFYVGTKGYQAPEILRRKPYTYTCDIFSCGVVLFILLSGYPPFETASLKCMWYSPLINENPREFWKQHRGCGISGLAKDLITRMLWYNAKKRISINGIYKHKWYNQKMLNIRQLTQEMRILHSQMEDKRNEDAEKQKELQYSMKRK